MGCTTSSEQGTITFYSNSEDTPLDTKINGIQEQRSEKKISSSIDSSNNGEQGQVLQEYLELESKLAVIELANPIEMLRVKIRRWNQLLNELDLAKRELGILEKLVAADLGLDDEVTMTVESAIKCSNGDSSTMQQQQEHFALLNKEEIALKAVQFLQDEKSQLEKEMQQLRTKICYLNSLYRQQDTLLDGIFGTEYASKVENILEAELDQIEEKKAAIVQISVLWAQARRMVLVASKHLATALNMWSTIVPSQLQNAENKFQTAAEVRDFLVLAGQNLSSVHQNLYEHVTLPYCTLDEINTLNKATTYVFTDMQSSSRHEHAAQCYKATYLRSKVLLQWIDKVINQIISRDLQAATAQFYEKSQQLRQERINLIINKIGNGQQSGREVFMRFEKGQENLGNHLSPIEESLTELDESAEVESNELLAPIPTSADISGLVTQIAANHEQELQCYLHELNTVKGRVSTQLEEVLCERRKRRTTKSMVAEKETALKSSI